MDDEDDEDEGDQVTVVMITGLPPAAQLQREDLNVASTMHEPPTSTMSNIFHSDHKCRTILQYVLSCTI